MKAYVLLCARLFSSRAVFATSVGWKLSGLAIFYLVWYWDFPRLTEHKSCTMTVWVLHGPKLLLQDV